jgi:hypothetical protein
MSLTRFCASAPALSRFKPRLKPEGVHLSFSPIQLCGGEFRLKVRKNSQLLCREFCIGEPPNYIIDDSLEPAYQGQGIFVLPLRRVGTT